MACFPAGEYWQLLHRTIEEDSSLTRKLREGMYLYTGFESYSTWEHRRESLSLKQYNVIYMVGGGGSNGISIPLMALRYSPQSAHLRNN